MGDAKRRGTQAEARDQEDSAPKVIKKLTLRPSPAKRAFAPLAIGAALSDIQGNDAAAPRSPRL